MASRYPVPGEAGSIAYPALAQRSEQPGEDSLHSTNPSAPGSPTHGAASPLSLTEYLSLGKTTTGSQAELNEEDVDESEADDERPHTPPFEALSDIGIDEYQNSISTSESDTLSDEEDSEQVPSEQLSRCTSGESEPSEVEPRPDQQQTSRSNLPRPYEWDAGSAGEPTTTRGDLGGRLPRSTGRSRPRGRRGWKWALKGTVHENVFKQTRIPARAAGTRPKGRARGRGGARVRIDPGQEFREIQTMATSAFLDGNLELAREYALEAVSMNAEIPAPHQLIQQILQAQGKTEAAIMAAMSAAVSMRDARGFANVAEQWLAYKGEEKTKDDVQFALKCFREALKIEKGDDSYELRAGKLQVYIDAEEWKPARRDCKAMIAVRPDDIDTVYTFAELAKTSVDEPEYLRLAKEAYYRAFDMLREQDQPLDVDTQWAHLDMYVDLMEKSKESPRDCIQELKRLARWFLGRQNEAFWDALDDDREFDEENVRRIDHEFFQQGLVHLDSSVYGGSLPLDLRVKLGWFRAKMGTPHHDEALKHLEHLLRLSDDVEDFKDLFLQTAQRLSGLSMFEMAFKFYKPLEDVQGLHTSKSWTQFGKCCRMLQRHEDAEKSLHAAIEMDDKPTAARVELAYLYESMGKNKEAVEVAHEISRAGRLNILRKEGFLTSIGYTRRLRKRRVSRPFKNIAPKKLIKSIDSQPPRQEEIPSTVSTSKGEGANGEGSAAGSAADTTPAATSARREARKRGSERQLEALRRQKALVGESHRVVQELWPRIEEGEDKAAEKAWIESAAVMTNAFRSIDKFYPGERSLGQKMFAGVLTGRQTGTRKMVQDMEELKKRLREAGTETAADLDLGLDESTPGEFFGITFPEWHHIFCTLVLLYARHVNQEDCIDLVSHGIMRANVFVQDPALLNTTLALSLYCSLLFNDRKLYLEAARQYIYQSDYRSGEAWLLFATGGTFGHGESPFEDGGSLQQWTITKIKQHDFLALPPEARADTPWSGDEHLLAFAQKVAPTHSDEMLPGLLTTYAHITNFSKHRATPAALSYLFRALALQPDNIVINLSLACTLLVGTMKKAIPQEDKRQGIAQGLSFLQRYYNLRVASGKAGHLQEAEFNTARLWQLQGRLDMAIPKYLRALELSDEVRRECAQEQGLEFEAEDFSKEAAFALQMIMVENGNMEAAQALAEEWLVM